MTKKIDGFIIDESEGNIIKRCLDKIQRDKKRDAEITLIAIENAVEMYLALGIEISRSIH